jgi:acyl-CoA thioesterase
MIRAELVDLPKPKKKANIWMHGKLFRSIDIAYQYLESWIKHRSELPESTEPEFCEFDELPQHIRDMFSDAIGAYAFKCNSKGSVGYMILQEIHS